MIYPTLSAYIFCFFTAVIVIFQLALALGAPWGEMAMGGMVCCGAFCRKFNHEYYYT